MMKTLLAFAICVAATLALVSVASADELTDSNIFETGGALYEEGNYEEAARTYQHLVGLGYEDATLYYNLANAYYKSEDMGRAVLNYLRARRLAPFDQDIAANLSFARQRSDAPNSEQATTPAFVQIAEFLPWITFNQSAIAALSAWLLLGLAGRALSLRRAIPPINGAESAGRRRHPVRIRLWLNRDWQADGANSLGGNRGDNVGFHRGVPRSEGKRRSQVQPGRRKRGQAHRREGQVVEDRHFR